MNSETRMLFVNPKTPQPCSLKHETLRVTAREKWGDELISRDEVSGWFEAGAPDKDNFLLCAASHKDQLPAQGSIAPGKMVDALIETGVLLSRDAT